MERAGLLGGRLRAHSSLNSQRGDLLPREVVPATVQAGPSGRRSFGLRGRYIPRVDSCFKEASQTGGGDGLVSTGQPNPDSPAQTPPSLSLTLTSTLAAGSTTLRSAIPSLAFLLCPPLPLSRPQTSGFLSLGAASFAQPCPRHSEMPTG